MSWLSFLSLLFRISDHVFLFFIFIYPYLKYLRIGRDFHLINTSLPCVSLKWILKKKKRITSHYLFAENHFSLRCYLYRLVDHEMKPGDWAYDHTENCKHKVNKQKKKNSYLIQGHMNSQFLFSGTKHIALTNYTYDINSYVYCFIAFLSLFISHGNDGNS
jgi:hypothetical protein